MKGRNDEIQNDGRAAKSLRGNVTINFPMNEKNLFTNDRDAF